MASCSYSNDQVRVGTVSKAIFSRNIIDSKYLVSSAQSIQHFEWRFMPMNITVVLTSSSYLFSISSPTMPSLTKVTSTLYLSTSSVVKLTGTNKAVFDSRDKERFNTNNEKEKETNNGAIR